MRIKLIGGLAAACLVLAASSGQADAQGAAPAAPQVSYGPPTPGVCVINYEYLLGGSVVGKYVQQRLQQLGAQAGAELGAERDQLKADYTTLEGQKATLSADELNKRAEALNARQNTLQEHYQRAQAEMERTRQKAQGTVLDDSRPIILQAFEQHGCSILLSSEGVIANAPSMDLTPAVVAGLDAKVQSFPFEREHIDPSQQGAAPAGR